MFVTNQFFYIEEVLLNYAEAMFEAGLFTQSVADATINKLRKRAGVADMKVADIDAGFDRNGIRKLIRSCGKSVVNVWLN